MFFFIEKSRFYSQIIVIFFRIAARSHYKDGAGVKTYKQYGFKKCLCNFLNEIFKLILTAVTGILNFSFYLRSKQIFCTKSLFV